MYILKFTARLFLTLATIFLLSNCGGGGGGATGEGAGGGGGDPATDPKYELEYKGLTFYHQNKASSEYKLNQLSNDEFNALSDKDKLEVADKILKTLFFGYPLKELKEKIASNEFMAQLRSGLEGETTDKGWLEDYILDDAVFRQFQSSWYEPQVITILSRFYAMKDLDKYFLNNWTAYVLTQTIMFSPAYELSSTHTPNISSVYNRLVNFLEEEGGMRFIAYVHMMSEDNWRRFRSPEDNGREMLEIYLLDADDSHVPIAGKALQNWKLNTDSDTLEVGLNQNTEALSLFGTTVYNGDDFYRELVKSSLFTQGVTQRLVDFFFPEKSAAKRKEIADAIVSSSPETWQDILLQIIFSEEYLLHNNRGQSAEETFYSLAKKTAFRHRRDTFYYLKRNLDNMHQASMKYKLGKLDRVPQDTLSFAHYHKYVREEILMKRANPEAADNDSWGWNGWMDSFIGFDKFEYDSTDDTASLRAFVDYLFESTVARKATVAEHALFKSHMIEPRDGKELFRYGFNMFVSYDDPEEQARRREERKRAIAYIVLDYISRLDRTYRQREVH